MPVQLVLLLLALVVGCVGLGVYNMLADSNLKGGLLSLRKAQKSITAEVEGIVADKLTSVIQAEDKLQDSVSKAVAEVIDEDLPGLVEEKLQAIVEDKLQFAVEDKLGGEVESKIDDAVDRTMEPVVDR